MFKDIYWGRLIVVLICIMLAISFCVSRVKIASDKWKDVKEVVYEISFTDDGIVMDTEKQTRIVYSNPHVEIVDNDEIIELHYKKKDGNEKKFKLRMSSDKARELSKDYTKKYGRTMVIE